MEIIKLDHIDSYGKKWFLCKCYCGNEMIVRKDNIHEDKTCGKHSSLSIYGIWKGIKRRCKNNWKNYEHVNICEEWDKSFDAFYKWALNHGYKQGLTIDRIDNLGNYCPENCRWATMKEQQNNRRNNHYVEYNGETLTLSQLSEKYNLDYRNLLYRLSCGDTIEEAINYKKPVKLYLNPKTNKECTLEECCKDYNANIDLVRIRLRKKWELQKALETPKFKPINYVSKQIGEVLIQEETDRKQSNKRIYKCKCSCGTIFYSDVYILEKQKHASCGCYNNFYEELKTHIGECHNELVITDVIRENNKWKYKCTCSCGETINIVTNKINNYICCGCLGVEKI